MTPSNGMHYLTSIMLKSLFLTSFLHNYKIPDLVIMYICNYSYLFIFQLFCKYSSWYTDGLWDRPDPLLHSEAPRRPSEAGYKKLRWYFKYSVTSQPNSIKESQRGLKISQRLENFSVKITKYDILEVTITTTHYV